jgi:hypothetical protein
MPDQVAHAVGTYRSGSRGKGDDWRFQVRAAGGRLWLIPQPGRNMAAGQQDPPFCEIEFSLREFWDALVEVVYKSDDNPEGLIS